MMVAVILNVNSHLLASETQRANKTQPSLVKRKYCISELRVGDTCLLLVLVSLLLLPSLLLVR